MKHATPQTIASLSPLLAKLRKLPGLKEKKAGIYYCQSKAFLHFHEEDDLIFADVRLTGEAFDRLPCTTQNEQSALLQAVRQVLL